MLTERDAFSVTVKQRFSFSFFSYQLPFYGLFCGSLWLDSQEKRVCLFVPVCVVIKEGLRCFWITESHSEGWRKGLGLVYFCCLLKCCDFWIAWFLCWVTCWLVLGTRFMWCACSVSRRPASCLKPVGSVFLRCITCLIFFTVSLLDLFSYDVLCITNYAFNIFILQAAILASGIFTLFINMHCPRWKIKNQIKSNLNISRW